MTDGVGPSGMLDGLRVLDLSRITAGGRTTQLLADFGADVIKVESDAVPDPFRDWQADGLPGGGGDLSGAPFRVVGRNKAGLALDLKHPRSPEVLAPLVASCDIVIENYRRGVLDRLGFGFDTLRGWNPWVVLFSISSQGSSGPERDYISYGLTLEALGGMLSMNGYDQDRLAWSTNKLNYPDQAVSLLAPGLAVMAVLHARASGRGFWLDLAQREVVTMLVGEWLARATATGEVARPPAAPEDDGVDLVCRVAGSDRWVALSVRSDSGWAHVASAIGHPELVTDARFSTNAARRASTALIREAVEAWTSTRDPDDVVQQLRAAGADVARVHRAYETAHIADRVDVGRWVPVPVGDGTATEAQVGWPFAFVPDAQPSIRRRAPHVGEDTIDVLGRLGIDQATVDDWLADGVIGQWEGPS